MALAILSLLLPALGIGLVTMDDNFLLRGTTVDGCWWNGLAYANTFFVTVGVE